MELDALADSLEIKRLINVGVLTSAEEAPANAKSLSARFVRTWREKVVSGSIDVKDAFLTVPQQTPTTVKCQLADGQSKDYSLGMVLPGQRDGSLCWHKAITGLLKSELSMPVHEPYPYILKTFDNSCFVLILVDDILVVGKKKFVMERLVKCLEKVYTISTQFLEKPGDELSFLKRKLLETYYDHAE